MRTIQDLERYLEDECYCFMGITIGKHHSPEGYVIKQEGDRYIFGHTERGRLEVLKSFETEAELVAHAYMVLCRDKWRKAHCVSWTWSKEKIKAAEEELRKLNIPFERNDVARFDVEHGRAYRIFVFGKDVKRLDDFRKRHWER